jgi:hypothetical protein
VLALLLFLLVSSAERLAVRALVNRATVETARAGLQQRDWGTADSRWRQLFQWPPARQLALRGMAQLYRPWLLSDKDGAQQALDGLAHLPGGSSALAYLGDSFRASRQMETARKTYETALHQGDFLSRQEDAQTRQKLLLLQQPYHPELVQNGDFGDTLDGWELHGNESQIGHEGLYLGCHGCRAVQTVPLFGSDSYHLTIVAKSGATQGNAVILLRLVVEGDFAWAEEQSWLLETAWQQKSVSLWVPVLDARAMRIEVSAATETPVVVQQVSLRLNNDQHNRLRNAWFETYLFESESHHVHFPGWEGATLWNEAQAVGWRTVMAGADSTAALEIGVTAAAGPHYRLGLEQLCGEFAPGATVTLTGHLWLPEFLAGAYAEVLVYLYQPDDLSDLLVLQLLRREQTTGWLRMATDARLPLRPQNYRCTTIVDVVAERTLSGVNNIARFDNLLLIEQGENSSP